MAPASLKLPAKLNLGLKVGGLREDGYHELRTVFQTVGIWDRLRVERSAGQRDRFEVTGRTENVPEDDRNLVLQTIQRVRERALTVPPIHIRLTKNIPTGAGLGGGSSDAAGLLKILRAWPGLDLDDSVLFDVATEVGADTAFFLRGGTVRGTGRGDRLEPLRDLDATALVAVPDYSVDTEWAYDSLEKKGGIRSFSGEGTFDLRPEHWSDLDLTNDFGLLVSSEYRTHDELFASLLEYTDAVSLSGSGSAVFGLFDDDERARETKRKLSRVHETVEFLIAGFIGRDEIPELERKASCRSK